MLLKHSHTHVTMYCLATVMLQWQSSYSKYETCTIGPFIREGCPHLVSPLKAITAYVGAASPSRAHLEVAGLVPLRLPESAAFLPLTFCLFFIPLGV